MILSNIRWILIGIFLVTGIAAPFTDMGIWVTIVLFATAFILILSHFKFGTVMSARVAIAQANVDKAEELLNQIKRPDWLTKTYQAYYHFVRALIASFRQDANAALEHSNQALAYQSLGAHEVAILRYNLARAAYENRDYTQAKEEYEKLKLLNIDDLHLKKRVEELKEALAHQ